MREISFTAVELLFAAAWILCRAAVWLIRRHIDWRREALLLLLYIDLAVIIRFTFFPMARADGRVQPLIYDAASVFPLRINLIPFLRLGDYAGRRDLLLNTIGNAALFIPTGIVLPVVFRKLDGFWKTVAAGAAVSLCIEILQLPFSVRASDIDDLILNAAGVAAGYAIYAAVRAICRRKAAARPRQR